MTRLLNRFRALSTAHKLTIAGLVLAGVPVITPWVTAAYDALFSKNALALHVEQSNDPCFSTWILASGHQDLIKSIHSADQRTLNRWERDRRITHRGAVDAGIGIVGNTARTVQIRDVSITVTRRTRPLPGTPTQPQGCGGVGGAEILFVDLDSLPLNRQVSGRYLTTSPQQESARRAAKEYDSSRALLSLPQDITTESVYDLMLVGRTQSHYCEWKATITWWDGEDVHETSIDNDGAPFRVSSESR